jgi:hypothetical protein
MQQRRWATGRTWLAAMLWVAGAACAPAAAQQDF